MTWDSLRAFAWGVVAELTWWAVRPIDALLNRGRERK